MFLIGSETLTWSRSWWSSLFTLFSHYIWFILGTKTLMAPWTNLTFSHYIIYIYIYDYGPVNKSYVFLLYEWRNPEYWLQSVRLLIWTVTFHWWLVPTNFSPTYSSFQVSMIAKLLENLTNLSLVCIWKFNRSQSCLVLLYNLVPLKILWAFNLVLKLYFSRSVQYPRNAFLLLYADIGQEIWSTVLSSITGSD